MTPISSNTNLLLFNIENNNQLLKLSYNHRFTTLLEYQTVLKSKQKSLPYKVYLSSFVLQNLDWENNANFHQKKTRNSILGTEYFKSIRISRIERLEQNAICSAKLSAFIPQSVLLLPSIFIDPDFSEAFISKFSKEKEMPTLELKEKNKASTKRGFKEPGFLNPSEQNKAQRSIDSIVTFFFSDNYNNLKQKVYSIKQFAPTLRLWSFAFGSSFFLIGITSILQRQEQNRWFHTFSRSVFPGLYLTSEESSWECFENITLKYLSKKSFRDRIPNAKNLVKKIDCYKDILYMGLGESWNQQAVQNYTAIYSKNSNSTLSQASLKEKEQAEEKDKSVTNFHLVNDSCSQRGISNPFFFYKKNCLKGEWIVQPWYQIDARVPPKKETTKTFKPYNQDDFLTHSCQTTFSLNRKSVFKPKINRYKEQVFIENDSIPSKMSSSATSNSKRWTLSSKELDFRRGLANKAFLWKLPKQSEALLPLSEKPFCEGESSDSHFQRADALSLSDVKFSNYMEKGKAKNYIDSPNDIIKNLFYESDNFCMEPKAFSLTSKNTDFLAEQGVSYKKVVQSSPKSTQSFKEPDFYESEASSLTKSNSALASKKNEFLYTSPLSPLLSLHTKQSFVTPSVKESGEQSFHKESGNKAKLCLRSFHTGQESAFLQKEAFEKVIYRDRFLFLQKESFFGLPSLSFRDRSSSRVAPFFCKISLDSLQAQSTDNHLIYGKNSQIDISLEQKNHLPKSRLFWHSSNIGAKTLTNSYRHFKESRLKKGEKISSYLLFKRKTVSNRLMSGYQRPETTRLRIKRGKKKSICRENSGIEFSIKVSPALPFFESGLKSLGVTDVRAYEQGKQIYNLFALFANKPIICKGTNRAEKKQDKVLGVTANQRGKREKREKLGNRIKSIIKLKKMPYKELSLTEKEEVESLFEQVNKTFYLSPYRFAFKKSLFADYNDYLSWPKDNPVAISINPFIKAFSDEEKRAIKDSWLSSSPETKGKTGFALTADTSGERRRLQSEALLSEFSQKLGSTPPLERALQGRFDENAAQSKSEQRVDSESPAGLSGSDPKENLSVESSNISEEEEKKKEITKSEWLEQIRESEQYLEKRKDLQKLAYPHKKALASRSLQKSPGKIHSLLVSDRKASFFGITNLFPKRLISEDQKQIAFKILRGGINQKSVSLLKNLNHRYGDLAELPQKSLSSPKEVGRFDIRKDETFNHSNEVEMLQNKIGEPINFDKRPKKQLQKGVTTQENQSASKSSRVPDQTQESLTKLSKQGERKQIVDLLAHEKPGTLVPRERKQIVDLLAHEKPGTLVPNLQIGDSFTNKANKFPITKSVDPFIQIEDLSGNITFNQEHGLASENNGLPIKLCTCTCKPLSFKKRTTKIITREHPIYTPNKRLRLRVPQLSLNTQNSNNQARIDDLNLSSEHRWWQKRRISSSLLGAPSKRYLVMPEISTQDWRKIIEWQLKIYFLEEEKRLLQMQTEEKMSSEKKAFRANLREQSDYKSKICMSPNKSTICKGTYVQISDLLEGVKEAFSGNAEKSFVTQAPDTKQLFTIKKLAIYLPWTSLKKSLKKPFEWPVTLLSYSSSLQPQKSRLFSASNRTCFHSPVIAKRGLCIANKAKQGKNPMQNFIRNKKTDSCFVSAISPPFKSAPFFAYKSSVSNPLCFYKKLFPYKYKSTKTKQLRTNTSTNLLTNGRTSNKAKLCNQRFVPVRSFVLENFYEPIVFSEGYVRKKVIESKQSHISKPFLFEAQTQNTYLLLHGLFLVIGLKRFLHGLCKIFGTLIISKIKNSSLSVLLLPLFFNAFGSSNKLYSFDSLKTKAKHLADSEDALSSLSEIVWYLRNSCRGRLVPRGVVLVEKRNSESTNFLKAIGGEAQVPVIVQSLRALPYTQNHPQRQLEKILTFAQKQAPCILFLDDLDSIGQSRKLLLKNNEEACKSEISINTFKSWREKTQQYEKYWVRNFPRLSKRFTTHLQQSKLLKGPILFGEDVHTEAFFDREKTSLGKKGSECKSLYCSLPKKKSKASYRYKSSYKSSICTCSHLSLACTCKSGGEKRKWKRYKNNFDKPFTVVTKTIDLSDLPNTNSCKASYNHNSFLDKGVKSSSYSRLPLEDLYAKVSTDSEKASYKYKICRPKYDGTKSFESLKNFSELKKTNITPFLQIEDLLGHPETEKVVEQRRVDLMLRLLTVMDGISGLNGVLIVTTSKNPSLLDPALLRPGRFEKLIHLKLPTKKKRILLLKRESAKLGHTNPMPWDFFGRQTQDMTGSDIASAVNHSAFRAIMQSTIHTFPTLEYGIKKATKSCKTPIYKTFCTKNKFEGLRPLVQNFVDPKLEAQKSLALVNLARKKKYFSRESRRRSKLKWLSALNRKLWVHTNLQEQNFASPNKSSYKYKSKICKKIRTRTCTPFVQIEDLLKRGIKSTRTKRLRTCPKGSLRFVLEDLYEPVAPTGHQIYDLLGHVRKATYVTALFSQNENKDKQTISEEISSQTSFYSAGKEVGRALVLGSSFHIDRSQKKYLIRTDFAKETIRLYAGQAALALYLNSISGFKNKWFSNTFLCAQKRPLALQSTFSSKEGFYASSIIKNMIDPFSFYPKTKESGAYLNIYFSYYNMVLSCFYVAFQNCTENRELLDLVTDHLVRFKNLKLYEMLRIILFYS